MLWRWYCSSMHCILFCERSYLLDPILLGMYCVISLCQLSHFLFSNLLCSTDAVVFIFLLANWFWLQKNDWWRIISVSMSFLLLCSFVNWRGFPSRSVVWFPSYWFLLLLNKDWPMTFSDIVLYHSNLNVNLLCMIQGSESYFSALLYNLLWLCPNKVRIH